LPSVLAIFATYAALRLYYRSDLRGAIATNIDVPPLSNGGRHTAYGLGVTALALLAASAFEFQLGAPTFAAGAATTLFVLIRNREMPWPLLSGVSWGVLPLVAGLFVLVAGLNATGVVAALSDLLRWGIQRSEGATAWAAGTGLAVATNLMNNLPAGLIAESAVAPVRTPESVRGALLIGVDLGPNLSVTGSLATILWLLALRRDGEHMRAADFLRVGIIAMPPALLLALGALILTGK
jgi:arsenical pump membrane protein